MQDTILKSNQMLPYRNRINSDWQFRDAYIAGRLYEAFGVCDDHLKTRTI